MRRRTVTLTALAVPATLLLATGAFAQGDQTAGDQTASDQTASDRTATEGAAEAETHRVALHDVVGARVGTVTLRDHGDRIRMTAALRDLEPGFHGFHVHTTGICDPDAPDGPFTSAGGHYVGDGAGHGTHAGDLPSLYVRADGTADLVVVTDAFTVDELLAGDGSAIMVHAGPDNFANIPDRYTSSASEAPGPDEATLSTGDAGDRVACGTLRADPGVERGAGLVTVPSEEPVAETVERITGDIESAGLTLVAVVDHAAAAANSRQELRPTTLVIFGDPRAGTPLMQSTQSAGIDLPQKLLVWEDAEGQTNVTYNAPSYLAARHGVTGQDELLAATEEVLRRLATGIAEG